MYYSGFLIGPINTNKLTIYLPDGKIYNEQEQKCWYGQLIMDLKKIVAIHEKLVNQEVDMEIIEKSRTCVNWMFRIYKLTGYFGGCFFFNGRVQWGESVRDINFITIENNQTIVTTSDIKFIFPGNILEKITLFVQKDIVDYRYFDRVRAIKKTLYIILRRHKLPKMLIKYLFEFATTASNYTPMGRVFDGTSDL